MSGTGETSTVAGTGETSTVSGTGETSTMAGTGDVAGTGDTRDASGMSMRPTWSGTGRTTSLSEMSGLGAPGSGPPLGLPPGAYAAALASLPGVGPGWLAELLANWGPEQAWVRALAGQVAPPRVPAQRGERNAGASGRVSDAARRMDVAGLWQRCLQRGIEVTWFGGQGYPSALASGPAPPGVLFSVGDIGWVERCPVVAVVGTRRCSPEGAATAYELARDLALAGVCVVSGLALGIDGAAHAGALSGFQQAGEVPPAASTAGVAASGVDVVYPRQHAALWRRVASAGAVVSETPPGSPAQPWRFPARNRVIAGLARLVVVVESHTTGGSWHTVDAALRRGVEVAAVPGSVHSPSCAGTNSLLRDGATPVRGAEDVLDALGLCASVGAPQAPPKGAGSPDGLDPIGPVEEKVLVALGWRPLCLEDVVERSGLPVGAVVVALERLEAAGAVVSEEGGWWSRRA